MTRTSYKFEEAAATESQLTHAERERLTAIKHRVEVSIARQYGDRLPAALASSHIRDCVTDRQVYLSTVSDGYTLSPGELDEAVQAMVMADELSRNALALSDAVKVQSARDAVLGNLTPARKIALARNGTLDAFLDDAARNAVMGEAA